MLLLNYIYDFSDALGTSAAQEDENKYLQFPMSNAFMDPLKLHFGKMVQDENDNKEINHWSHDHPLILNGKNMRNASTSDSIEVCDGCVRPLSLPYYSCKYECGFSLHKYCAELPLVLLGHQLHPYHSLHLVNTRGYNKFYMCYGCYSYGNTFAYKCESCYFHLDVNCVFLPKAIKHEIHKHPLIQHRLYPGIPTNLCGVCNMRDDTIRYKCQACKFTLDMNCAMRSPHSLTHRYCKGHEILLTYPPVEDHPEDFYCEICEKEMHPKYPLYHCQKCKNSFHIRCLAKPDGRLGYENVKEDGTISVPYHKHPLTFVRRKKTTEDVCFRCNRYLNGCLMLECRVGACPFRVCYACHYKKLHY